MAANKKSTPRKKSARKKAAPAKDSSAQRGKASPVKKAISKTARRKSRAKSPGRAKRPQSIALAAETAPAAEIAVVASGGDDRFALLEQALQQSGFWIRLEEKRFRTGREAADFAILIKPDMDACELAGSTATDPALVEHLVDLMHARGYTSVTIGDSRNSHDNWLENRDVQILADILGYRYITENGNDYDVIDLAEETLPGPFADGSLLAHSELPRAWNGADFRIVFAKNKTDDENAVYLCLDNLISVLPLRDKDYHYKHRLERSAVLLELLQHVEVDFCLIDAWISNHGSAGSRVARPLGSRTLIAGADPLLVDYAACAKMGLDYDASPPHRAARERFGLPSPHRIDGDLSPYPGWINVPPLLLDANRRRAQWVELDQILQPWLQSVDDEVFAFKDPVNARINAWVSRYLQGIDDNPNVSSSLLALNYLIAFIYLAVDALRVMHWKDSLWHKEAPINIDIDAYPFEAYAAIADYLEPLEAKTLELDADSHGLRWMFHHDGSVLFEFSRVIPVDYDDFVGKVDISRSIQYMTDYIGGQIMPLKKDRQGRVTHQIERNLYLPQPNYLVFYQGQDIDVSKLEYIRYRQDRQQMLWRTVKSENGSATYDDGMVRFIRAGAEATRVSIFGRQQFTLPLFWQIVDLDNFPALKERLFNHAYTSFFTQTMANFEAVYEGRDVRIGKRWDAHFGETGAAHQGSPSDRLVELLTRAGDVLERNLPDREGLLSVLLTSYKPTPEFIDEDGFAHFKSAAESRPGAGVAEQAQAQGLKGLLAASKTSARGYWQDVYDAVLKDSGLRPG